MKPRWRVVVPAAILGVFGLVAVLYPQDVSDIGTMAKDLRSALKDLDGRLRHLEQLVKELSKADKDKDKVVSTDAPARPTPSTSKRFAAQEAYQKGRIEEDSQQYAKAIELFKKATELDPTNESAFLHRAMANYKIGRVDEALYNVNRSITIQPDNSRAIAFRATVYQTMKDYDRAVADLADAARRDTTNPDYLVAEGSIEEERGNFSKAADLYAAALAIKPDSAEIHLKRAAALKSTDNPQAALDECSQAIAFKPKDAGGYACRADYHVRQGQFPAAVSDLNQALAIRPDFPQAVSLLPVVQKLLEVNRAAANLAAAKQAAVTQAANDAALNQAANQVAVVQPPPVQKAPAPPVQVQPAPSQPVVDSSAITVTPAPTPTVTVAAPAPEPLIEPPPVSIGSLPAAFLPATVEPTPGLGKLAELLAVARRYLDEGNFGLAVLKLNEAVNLEPASAPAYNARGYAYLRSRNYTSALADFSKAIEIRPSYANAYWNRGVARRLLGDKQGSVDDAQKAIHLGWVVDSSSLKLKASR